MVELHCPVICYYKNPDGEILYLVAKRSNERKILPGKWEFGAAKPNESEFMKDTIIKEYKDDFGIIIDLVQENGSLLPFSTYEIYDSGKLHKGLIFIGKILNPLDIKITQKHSEYIFDTRDVILSSIKNFDDTVPNFINNIITLDYKLKHNRLF